ncbi:HEXXH motif domain-containing protein [Catenuloplanes atrovinosus]|uniref:HEXXH motif-containing protein n=1 Tax=Catenuloplanes atrovinosus TaxID=137266 RepID=A0AAE3YKS6_9ACTN|nr:HEXXH motif domain-containing protein [Catenuloplanes atrovinosus]MDR7274337.1 HEXXH motif-containing protein [Catenuloplanes atrovinosus]
MTENPALTAGFNVAEAWNALERAQDAAPEAITGLLMHPHVGAWIAYALRRHRGGTSSDAPIAHDFGQLTALALAAAALAGQDFTTRVPLRDGRANVPCFGMAHFDGAAGWDTAEAGTTGGRLWLSHGGTRIDVPASGDGDGWYALRRVTAGDGPRLSVWLDDLDPLRDLADPVAPARLSAAELSRWTELITDAWSILCRVNPEMAAAMEVGVTSLVPLPVNDGWDTRSASTGDAFGAIMCSLPPDAVTLAVSLAHEFMHIKLGGLMHLVPLMGAGGEPTLYAPWRDDPRPPGGLLQGVYAFAGIADFWRRYLRQAGPDEAAIVEFEYAYARSQAQEGLATAQAAPELTEAGRRFTDALGAELASWPRDETPGSAAELARLVADAHRAGWRIRHCRPDPADIETLRDALRAAAPVTSRVRASTVRPDPAMRHWSQGRLGLARRRIVAPDRFEASPGEAWGAGLFPADLALFRGDARTAVREFGELVAEDPGRPDAWTGLGLALRADGDKAAAAALLERPEIVAALYPGAGRSPRDLADWVGTEVLR